MISKSLVVRSLIGLMLSGIALLALSGCQDSEAAPEMQDVSVTANIASPLLPTDADVAGAVLRPETIPTNAVCFKDISIYSPQGTELKTAPGDNEPAHLMITAPVAPGRTETKPLGLQVVDGSVRSAAPAILLPGDCLITLGGSTNILYDNFVQHDGFLLTEYKLAFSVNNTNTPSWTLPTNFILALKRLPDGNYVLRGTSLTLTWDGVTRVPPVDRKATVTLMLYDRDNNVVKVKSSKSGAAVGRSGAINRAVIKGLSNVPFAKVRIYIDLRNNKSIPL